MTNYHVCLSHSREATKKKKRKKEKKKKRKKEKKSVSRRVSFIENGQISFKFLQYQTLPYEMSSWVIKHAAGHRLHTNFLW